MQLFSWLHQRMSARSQTRRTPARKPGPRFRPHVEILEDRYVPSTLTVVNNSDSGAGSLRAEIGAANPGDTINFATSLDNQAINLTSGQLVINKNLTIHGPGASLLAISGGNSYGSSVGSRVFEVYGASTNVTLSGLTITQGNSQGTLDPGYGGGIDNENGSTLTVSGCTLSNNRAVAYGGGIYNLQATLTIVNSTLSGNYAGCGGGIDNDNGATLTVSGCTLSNNRAVDCGGGIYNFGATLNVVNSNLSGNVVNNSSSGGGEGGAVYSDGLGLTVSMTGCTLSHNTAGFAGGGVYITSTIMTISGCTLSGNVAQVEGSAINNHGWVTSGKKHDVTTNLTVSNSYFSNNSPTNQFPIDGLWTDGGGNTFA
jgi:hypothetical protein